MCFDLACSFFHDWSDGFINTPSQARAYYANQEVKFFGATVFDSRLGKYRDFIDCDQLIDCLDKADELITFNGRVYDLVFLELKMGSKVLDSLWRKPHHDLAGWKGWSLKGTSKSVMPVLARKFDSVAADRKAKIATRHDNVATLSTLAGTYRDAKFTYEVFKRYAASGDSQHTFHDLQG